MTNDEASARAREAVWDAAFEWTRGINPTQRCVDALDALIRLERARGRVEAFEESDCDYDGGVCWTCANELKKWQAELTAAIKALDADTPRSGTEA